MSIKRTLITGFGPFGAVTCNPSARVVEYFALHGAPGHAITTHVFPVSYADAEEGMRNLLASEDYPALDNVLMLGVNSDAREWRIESVGRNYGESGSTDVSGTRRGDAPIVPGMPVTIECTLPCEEIVAALKSAQIPAAVSNSAGGYLCNHLLYYTLAMLVDRPETCAGFIHVPADTETYGASVSAFKGEQFSHEMHVRAVEVVLAALA